MLGILRFLRGYVDFSVSGKYPERFMNSAFKSGVRVWSQKSREGNIQGRMYVSDYKRSREKARKTGVRLRVVKKHGLPFFVYRNKKRVGVLAGAAVFFVIIFMLSSFVWTINIEGVTTVSQNDIKQLLRDCGVYESAKISEIDVQWTKRQLSHKYPMITWSAVNIYGSNVDVIVKEGQEKNQPDISTPADIVAKKDGFIVSMETREGVNQVKPGESVLEGQLLVSSAVELEGSDTRFVRGQSKIMAQTSNIAEFSVSENIDYISSMDEAVERIGVDFFGFSFPVTVNHLGADGEWKGFAEEKSLELNGVMLPIGIVYQKNYRYTAEAVQRTEEMLEKAFAVKEALYETFNMPEAVITGRTVYEEERDGILFRKNAYSCIEDIAQSKEFTIEQ